MKSASSEGLRVQYESGLTRRLDSAIRQNILDGVRDLNRDMLYQIGKEYGADGVELSAHYLCAEDHLPYQGKQFTNKEFERLQNMLPRPFGMWNCKHTIFPIIVGISEPANSEADLEEYRKNSSEKITIDGKTMSRYEWTQEQRKIETAVRQQKDIGVAAKAAGDMQLRRETQANINKLMDRYDEISQKAGLHTHYERTRVAGYRSVKTAGELKNPQKSGIIEKNRDEYFRVNDASGNEKYKYIQTDAIQKLETPEEIAKYFQYEDKWGDTMNPIEASFSALKIDVQKELAEGIEWARQTYGLDELPLGIESKVMSECGKYIPSKRLMLFKKSIQAGEAFSTSVHEMTHYADHIFGNPADEIVETARINLKFRANSKEYSNLKQWIVGITNKKAMDDPHELLAYALEAYATNRSSNKLGNEISRLWLERVMSR